MFVKVVPQCHTCMSDFRPFIEEQYLVGTSVKNILEILATREGGDISISERAMHEHFRRGHCTTPAAIRQLRTWQKAAELGVDPQTYNEVTDSSVAITKLAIDQIKEDFLAGRFDMDAKDRLAFLKLWWDMEKVKNISSGLSGSSEDMFIAVSIFMGHVAAVFARFLPMQQQEAVAYFQRLVEADPILKEIVERTREILDETEDFNADEDDGNVVDGEIVDIPEVPVAQIPETRYTGPLEDTDIDWNQEEPWS